MMAWALWITGLPGSGKSTIAAQLIKLLYHDDVAVDFLRLDEIRKQFVPSPKYTEEERDFVYAKIVESAGNLISSGRNVVIDATAHRRKYRDAARGAIPNFFEVHVRCDISVCIERESERKEGLVTAEMYRKAILRREGGKRDEGLGEVVGVDVPFEEGGADLVVESDIMSSSESAKVIFENLKKRGFVK